MFSVKLKEYRIKKGFTQDELAKELMVSRQTVSKWENGSNPDVETIVRLSELLDVSTDVLLRGNQKPSESLLSGQLLNDKRVKVFIDLLIIISIIVFVYFAGRVIGEAFAHLQ